MADFNELKEHVLTRLEAGLTEQLSYHSVDHTLDVLAAAERIGKAEGLDGATLELVKVAALLHDTGFLIQYFNNEPEACKLGREWMPLFGYNENQVELVSEMIMATKIPQNPSSFAAAVLCDADLDYLGRDDFYPIGRSLFEEFLYHGVVEGEKSWNRLQVSFLESHAYFTKTAIETRSGIKMRHLNELKTLVNSYI